jgi:hypothetical protein
MIKNRKPETMPLYFTVFNTQNQEKYRHTDHWGTLNLFWRLYRKRHCASYPEVYSGCVGAGLCISAFPDGNPRFRRHIFHWVPDFYPVNKSGGSDYI